MFSGTLATCFPVKIIILDILDIEVNLLFKNGRIEHFGIIIVKWGFPQPKIIKSVPKC